MARPCLAIPDKAVDPEYIALNISSVCPLPAKDTLPPGLFSVLSTSAGFSRDEYEFYCSLLKKRIVKKKEHYLQAGDISRATAYVNSGCLRQYIIGDDGKEIIIQFALEDWWIGDLESFHYEKPSIFWIQAL